VEDFELEPGRTWTSPETGSRYPVEWRLRIPAADLELTVVPLLDAQEMALSVRYWEGAVRARGTRGDRTMAGRGYLELAGY
jgi:predicted secreted hydrolase